MPTEDLPNDASIFIRRNQCELTDFEVKLRVGLEQCDRGEVDLLDANTIKIELRQRLAQASVE